MFQRARTVETREKLLHSTYPCMHSGGLVSSSGPRKTPEKRRAALVHSLCFGVQVRSGQVRSAWAGSAGCTVCTFPSDDFTPCFCGQILCALTHAKRAPPAGTTQDVGWGKRGEQLLLERELNDQQNHEENASSFCLPTGLTSSAWLGPAVLLPVGPTVSLHRRSRQIRCGNGRLG
jgi:hypothetical protein